MKSLSFCISLIIFLTSSTLVLGQVELDRVEPPFWWVGFENSELQIVLHGEKMSDYRAKIDYPGVTLTSQVQVESPNYLFLNLEISPDALPGAFDITLTDGKKSYTVYNYSLKARGPEASEVKGFDGSDVMYLITPDRFANGNQDNDNVEGMQEQANREFKGGRHGGDIQGMIDHLDYISDLGFTAIWVNPLLENDQPEYSYHGYSTTDFYQVDPRLGDNELYREFVKRADEKDIKVIMDMILNHIGSEHWWMDDLPTSDWINFNGSFVPTNHTRQTIQDPHASDYDYRHFVDGWFVETMPDMNQSNKLLSEYLIQNTIWWIEYLGISGIRMDTYPYPERQFMTDWTCRIMEEYPYFNIVGEEWSVNPAIVSFWQMDKVNPNGYVSCLPSVMDFPLQSALSTALNEEQGMWSGWLKVYESLANDFLYAHPENLVVFPDNHDMDRFYTQVGEDTDLFKLGLAFYLTTRGTPQLYYGTELLMSNPGSSDHGIIRSDFPGGWPGDSVVAKQAINLTEAQQDASDYLKKLLNWRKSATAIHKGKLKHFRPYDGFYVYFRYDENQKVMVVLSKNKEDKVLPIDRLGELLNPSDRGREILTGREINFSKPITVPAMTPMIIEMD